MADSEVAPEVTTAPAEDVVKTTIEATKELIKEAKEAAAKTSDEKKEEPSPTPVEEEVTPVKEAPVEEKPIDEAPVEEVATPVEEEPKPTEAEAEPVDVVKEEEQPKETVESTEETPVEEESKPIEETEKTEIADADEEPEAVDEEEPKDEIADIEEQISMFDETKDLAEIHALEKKLAILKREKEMMALQAQLEEMRSLQEGEQRELEEEERAIAEAKAAEEERLKAEAPTEPSWSIFDFFKSKKEDEEITEEMKEVVEKAETVVAQQVKQQKPVELTPEDMFLSSIAYALVDFVHGPPRGPPRPSAAPKAAPATIPEESAQDAEEIAPIVAEAAPQETESAVEGESAPHETESAVEGESAPQETESPMDGESAPAPEVSTEPTSTPLEESTETKAAPVEDSAPKEIGEEGESPEDVKAEGEVAVEDEEAGQEVMLQQMSPESAFITMALNDLNYLVNTVIDDTYETKKRVTHDSEFLTDDVAVSQSGSGLELESSKSREERYKNNKYGVSPGVYKFKKDFQKAIIDAGHTKDPVEAIFDDMGGSMSGEMSFVGEVLDNLRHTLRTQMGPEIGYLTYEVAGTPESDARYEQIAKAKKEAFKEELKKQGLVLTTTLEQDNDVLVLDSKAQQVASPEAIAVKHMFDSIFNPSPDEDATQKAPEVEAPPTTAPTAAEVSEEDATTPNEASPAVIDTQQEEEDKEPVEAQPTSEEETAPATTASNEQKPEALPESKPTFTVSAVPETEDTNVPDDAGDDKSTASDDSDAVRDAAFDKALATGTFDNDDEKKEEDPMVVDQPKDMIIPNVSSAKSEATDSTVKSDEDAGEALTQEAA